MSEQTSEANSSQESQMTSHDVEKLEEAKLKAKYPGGFGSGPGRSISGHSAFLQKRLAKGQKFFDSGDYQMAKQKLGGCGNVGGGGGSGSGGGGTGGGSGNVSKQPVKVPAQVNPYATGEAIPTPETVPARKTSIIQSSKFTSNQNAS